MTCTITLECKYDIKKSINTPFYSLFVSAPRISFKNSEIEITHIYNILF